MTINLSLIADKRYYGETPATLRAYERVRTASRINFGFGLRGAPPIRQCEREFGLREGQMPFWGLLASRCATRPYVD